MDNDGPITDDVLEEMRATIHDKELMARIIMCHEIMSRQSVMLFTPKGIMCAMAPDDLDAMMGMFDAGKAKIVEDMEKQAQIMQEKIKKYKD
jgi:hypothetical protein